MKNRIDILRVPPAPMGSPLYVYKAGTTDDMKPFMHKKTFFWITTFIIVSLISLTTYTGIVSSKTDLNTYKVNTIIEKHKIIIPFKEKNEKNEDILIEQAKTIKVKNVSTPIKEAIIDVKIKKTKQTKSPIVEVKRKNLGDIFSEKL